MIFCTTILDKTKDVVDDDVAMENIYSINTGNLYGVFIGKNGAVYPPQSDVVKQSSSKATVPIATEEVYMNTI